MAEKFLGNRIVGVWMTLPTTSPESKGDNFYYDYPANVEKDDRIEWKPVIHNGKEVLWAHYHGIKLIYDEEE